MEGSVLARLAGYRRGINLSRRSGNYFRHFDLFARRFNRHDGRLFQLQYNRHIGRSESGSVTSRAISVGVKRTGVLVSLARAIAFAFG